MSDIKEAFESRTGLLTGKGVSAEAIEAAQKELGLVFAEEYREYLKLYGIAAYNGHELTGLTKSPRVNVVAVTKEQKERQKNIPEGLYVVEETDVEEIVIWQSESGEVFASSVNSSIEKVCNSLSEYICR